MKSRAKEARPGETWDTKSSASKPLPGWKALPSAERPSYLQKQWNTRSGQLWIIPSKANDRSHRLLCGDSADAAAVERLLGAERPALLGTDPPYGVDYRGGRHPRAVQWTPIANDARSPDDYRDWLASVLRIWIARLSPDAAFYLWSAALKADASRQALEDVGLHVQSQIVWSKNCFVLGRADYHWRHEAAWYAFRRGAKHRWFGGRKQSTVWPIPRVHALGYLHPMQKPTELYAIPIRNHTLAGEAVAEPFAGSGSQFLAAEAEGRVCLGMEISPDFTAVCLERMAHAGLTPVLSRA